MSTLAASDHRCRQSRKSRRRLQVAAALALVLVLLAAISVAIPARPVAAHAELTGAEPPADALLAAGPSRISLRFSEPVAEGAGSPSLRLVDASGRDLELGGVAVAADDPHRVSASVSPLGPGTYTVVWATRSSVDGHSLTGTYAFRIGGGRVPGAATTEGETPRPWAVATRWLTFLGAAVAAGGFFAARLLLSGLGAVPSASLATPRRLRLAALAGAAIALVATLAEPALQTVFPPAGAIRPALGDAIRALPDAWWLRPVALTVALAIAATWVGSARPRRVATGRAGMAQASASGTVAASTGGGPLQDQATTPDGTATTRPWLEWAGLVAALGALVGLSLTGHAAARGDVWRLPAMLSNVAHQWAVALWVGGLVHLALLGPRARSGWTAPTGLSPDVNPGPGDAPAADVSARPDPVRRFSPIALGLVVVGVATGVANTGLLLPTVDALWESRYGVVVLLKAAALVPVLALATWHRVWLRRAATRALSGGVASVAGASAGLRQTLRCEAVLVVLVVLGGSVLAMSAPPVAGEGHRPDAVELAAPAAGPDGRTAALVRLRVSPVAPGENTLTVTLADPAGAPIPLDPAAGRVGLDAVSLLDAAVARTQVPTAPDGASGFTTRGLALSTDGWWRVTATVRRAGEPDLQAAFYLLVPDPSLHGGDALAAPDPSEAAAALFARGRAAFEGATRFRYHESLGSGSGTVAVSDWALESPAGGGPASVWATAERQDYVRIGGQEWLRSGDGNWIPRAALPGAPSLAELTDEYDGAKDFRLGRVEQIGDRSCQVVTFAVPDSERLVGAWYAWWVDVETGHVCRVTMVTRGHYMVRDYTDYDGTFAIAPPA